jgi:nitroimidazol reductase NimA-like FMN-containing flavoprotein (pyridoxamine 5'-phosphate oxidase superfamily)
MSSPQALQTERTTLRRLPQRGSHDRAVIDAILDEALFCHLGFTTPPTPLSGPQDCQPFVLPTIHARVEDQIYVHGSAASRMLRSLADGAPVCLTATLLDGLVLARSAFHHSMNYRSVVVLGNPQVVVDEAEKLMGLRAIVEHVAPGRWNEVRAPDEKEMRATSVLRLPLTEASAKIRTGPPVDDEEDFALPVWAGVLPLRLVAGELVAEPRLAPSIGPTPAVMEAARRGR